MVYNLVTNVYMKVAGGHSNEKIKGKNNKI
jgi:hypothetical protein